MKSPNLALGLMQENWDLGKNGEIKYNWTLGLVVGCKIRRMEMKPTIPSLRFVKMTTFPKGGVFP